MQYQDYTTQELQLACHSILERDSRFQEFVIECEFFRIGHGQLMELQLRFEEMESLYEHFDEIALRLEKASWNSSRSDFEARYFKALAQAKRLLIIKKEEKKEKKMCCVN